MEYRGDTFMHAHYAFLFYCLGATTAINRICTIRFLIYVSLFEFITCVDPVKVILSTSICWLSAAPAVLPNPGTIFTTPGGKPA